jgi:N6-adenosine-specific RNA methylase IME4
VGNPEVRSGGTSPKNSNKETLTSLEVSSIVVGKRQRQDLGDLGGLMQSMRDLGLLHPIVLDSKHKLISGERRLAAARALGWHSLPVTIAHNLDDALLALQAERDENTERLDLTQPEKIAMADALMELEKPAAEDRHQESGKHGKDGGRGKKKNRGDKKSPRFKEAGRAKARAAKAAGMSRATYEHGKEIIDSDDDECKEQLNRGVAISRVYKKLKTNKARKENRKLVETSTPLELIAGEQYQTIVIDPPWDWGDEGDEDQLGRARPEYATMSIDELLKLPVEKLAKANCHLYLWITNRALPKGFALIEKWNFRYITALTFVKPSYGMGNYFRGSTEHVLFAVRGSQPLLRNDLGTHFVADRTGVHSGKPPEFYAMVETASPGPWLEIFAREERPGWAAWGAEVQSVTKGHTGR